MVCVVAVAIFGSGVVLRNVTAVSVFLSAYAMRPIFVFFALKKTSQLQVTDGDRGGRSGVKCKGGGYLPRGFVQEFPGKSIPTNI